MTPFEFLLPYSLDEALSLLDADDPAIRPIGGGTAVMLMMKAGVLHPTRLVSLQKVGVRHARIEVGADGHLLLGGLARLADIEASPAVRKGWPLLAQALRGVANPRVRAVATIGGNLAHADPHMDMPPVMSALGAQVTIRSAAGSRSVPADTLCTGYYETVLRRDELITELRIPPQAGPGTYLKMTTRAAHDWPALGLAIVLGMDGERVSHASVLVGAATDKPTRLSAAEAILVREGLTETSLRNAAEAGAGEAPISADAHGSAAYKRHLLRVALPRAIHTAMTPRRSAA